MSKQMSPQSFNLTGAIWNTVVRYSAEFKKSAVHKLLSRGDRTVSEIVDELGIASPSIFACIQLRIRRHEF